MVRRVASAGKGNPKHAVSTITKTPPVSPDVRERVPAELLVMVAELRGMMERLEEIAQPAMAYDRRNLAKLGAARKGLEDVAVSLWRVTRSTPPSDMVRAMRTAGMVPTRRLPVSPLSK